MRLRRRDGAIVLVEVALVEVTTEAGPGLLAWSPGQGSEPPGRLRRTAHMSALVAGLAHELNNPLTYLTLNLGFVDRELQALRNGLDEGTQAPTETLAQALDALRVAREGVERLTATVRDLRAFSRTGHDLGPVDPRRCLEMALALTRNHLRHKARLEVDLQEVSEVEASEAQLSQALVTVLMSLTQGNTDGGAGSCVLLVSLHDGPSPGEVEMSFTLRGSQGERACFEPDLEACRVAIGEMGLVISDEAQARLSLRLPAVDAPHAAQRPSTPPPSGRMVRPRVLLIEDDATVASALTALITPEADLVWVASGREAIDLLLRDQNFPLILCDLMMPDIGGVDVHEAIRRSRPGVESRMVFLTGGAFTPRCREFLRTMPNRTLDKPVDPELLLSLVRSAKSTLPAVLASARG